jgi:hypothetical protein
MDDNRRRVRFGNLDLSAEMVQPKLNSIPQGKVCGRLYHLEFYEWAKQLFWVVEDFPEFRG